MNRTQVVAYVLSLSDKQLIELFYEATDGRRIFGDTVRESKLVLANTSRDSDNDEVWNVELLATHDPHEYPMGWADDVPICQESESEGFAVFSYAKQMICPITGRSIGGT